MLLLASTMNQKSGSLVEYQIRMNFVPLARNTKFIDYENAQIILIGAREGKDVIKNEIGIEIEEDESPQSADIFDKLSKKGPDSYKTTD